MLGECTVCCTCRNHITHAKCSQAMSHVCTQEAKQAADTASVYLLVSIKAEDENGLQHSQRLLWSLGSAVGLCVT